MDRKVYLDNASSSYVSSEVLNEMMPCFVALYGDTNSVHTYSSDANAMVNRAKEKVAKAINAGADEIHFTSGGTEANNWAIKGIAHANSTRGKHIIVSKIEHESVLASCKELEKEGFEIDYIGCDSEGVVSVAQLLHYLREDTILVSVMAVNDKVGTIQNLKALASVAHDKGAIFHTDAVQAVGHIKLDVVDMGIDALTLSGHVINGPKGVGALYVKNSVAINDLISGERTVNVPGVVGLGKAVELATRDFVVSNQKMKTIRDYFVRHILEKVEYAKVNGHPYQKVNNIVCMSFDMVDAESVAVMLDMEGIAVKNLESNYVINAMKVDESLAKGTVRFSFGKSISKDEVDYVVETVSKVVAKLRAISPITKTGRAK